MSRGYGDARAVLPARELHPEVCGARGHCGPFANTAIYNRMPGWEGFGDCIVCGSTVRITPVPRAQHDASQPTG